MMGPAQPRTIRHRLQTYMLDGTFSKIVGFISHVHVGKSSRGRETYIYCIYLSQHETLKQTSHFLTTSRASQQQCDAFL